MKHKNYDMIAAKAANMDLAVFIGTEEDGWIDSDLTEITYLDNNFFLCLPKHKEACLHWLNGGELTIDNGKGFGASTYTLHPHHKPLTDFISHPEYTFRIKYKKEKRWVCVKKSNNQTCPYLYMTKEEAESVNIPRWWTYHEIEV